METPAQMCARLVVAIEDLVQQESACLQTRDFAAVVALQRRVAPLVDHLAAHASDVTDSRLRARIAAIISRRQESGTWLAVEIERTREKLHSVEVRKRQVGRVAPVYGRTTPARNQLLAFG